MKKVYCFIIAFVAVIGCKEVYNPPTTSSAAGYLVVEGFINSGSAPTVITLTRTTRLVDSVDIIYEYNAQVNIESINNESYPLHENGNGVYISDSLSLTSNEKYRLHVRTTDGKEYVSDYSVVKYTPNIDSVSWQIENGGVQLYVNTHDPQNNTRYYRWNYTETWEFHSAYLGNLKYSRDPFTNQITGLEYKDPVSHASDTTIYKCWNTLNATTIFLGTSEKLSSDIIYLFPLRYIEPQSVQLSVLYSILVKQYALSHDAYLFSQKIKKNTEQLGSIFDPQPSELRGNIHCITDPSEIVVGYVEVSQEQQQRIFIYNNQLPHWNYQANCAVKIIDNQIDSILKYGSALQPTVAANFERFTIKDFYASDIDCVDCTTHGTNIKPPFWP